MLSTPTFWLAVWGAPILLIYSFIPLAAVSCGLAGALTYSTVFLYTTCAALSEHCSVQLLFIACAFLVILCREMWQQLGQPILNGTCIALVFLLLLVNPCTTWTAVPILVATFLSCIYLLASALLVTVLWYIGFWWLLIPCITWFGVCHGSNNARGVGCHRRRIYYRQLCEVRAFSRLVLDPTNTSSCEVKQHADGR